MRRRKETLSIHAWMLKTLLQQSGSRDGLEVLQLYIIAVCSNKMKYRLSNGPSPLYFDCLEKLCGTTFPFIEHPDVLATRRDGSCRDQFFLDAIPMLAEFAMTKIPNLKKVAQLAQEKKPFEVYNNDTYMEFHELLCELLRCFDGSLTVLVDLKTHDVEKIRQALSDVRNYGDLLGSMVRGSAIEKHLRTIAPFLDTHWGGVDKEVVGVGEEGIDEEGVVDKEGVDVDQDDDEGEIEFDVLKPYTICRGKLLQPWESYRDWLMLQIIYFDAIQTTTRYVSSFPSFELSIKILTPSLPSTEMLPWGDLLTSDRYFPQPLGTELFDCLSRFAFDQQETELEAEGSQEKKGEGSKGKKGEGSKEKKGKGAEKKDNKATSTEFELAIKSVKRMQRMPESEIDTLVDSAANQVASLKNCPLSPPDREFPEALRKRILQLKARHLPPNDRLNMIESILQTLNTMKGQSLLYQKLRKDAPLGCGKRFPGTRHCEACIASLKFLSGLHRPLQADALLESLLAEFKVSRVLTHCPILCQHLRFRQPVKA
jgi:hypothetical protein